MQLENFATVEISTAIVAEIIEDVFIPWEVYQAIYSISRNFLTTSAIDLSLHHRYLQLRRQLELAYNLLLINPHSPLYDRTVVREVKQDLPLLAQSSSIWENIPSKLPPPISSVNGSTQSTLNKLLEERSFLYTLRQLGKTKALLDQRNRHLHQAQNTITDMTYAQTIIQLDGKIINRYAQTVLEQSDRDRLLKLHEKSVIAAEKQWRGLLKFAALLNKSLRDI